MTLLRARWAETCVVFVLTILCVVSFSTLLTKPKLWTDEAVTLEIARNIHEHGSLNAMPSPGMWYPAPYVLQSTGYPVTLSLAAVFSIFDYGFTQARIVMLLWMLAALIATFIVIRGLFSKEIALGSILLLATFASFHANGRTATGEVPGFALLMLGVYFWLEKRNLWIAGALWGLTVVTKPSLFIFLIPTITITLLLQSKPFLERVFDVACVGFSMIPAGLLWIFLVIPEPFSMTAWQTMYAFLTNPFATEARVMPSLGTLIFQPTIAYFTLWFVCLVFAFRSLSESKQRAFYLFVGIFTAFAFWYYLQSPGWLRYFMIGELLVLILLPSALSSLSKSFETFLPRLFVQSAVPLAIGAITLFQIAQFTTADIYSSDTSLRVAEYINTTHTNDSVLTLGNLGISVLLATPERYTYIQLDGIPPLGNPLSSDYLPTVVIVEDAEEGTNYYTAAASILQSLYVLEHSIDALQIYTLAR